MDVNLSKMDGGEQISSRNFHESDCVTVRMKTNTQHACKSPHLTISLIAVCLPNTRGVASSVSINADIGTGTLKS